MDFLLLTDKRCTKSRAKGRHRQSNCARLTQHGGLGQGRHPTPFKAVLVGSPRGHWSWTWSAPDEPLSVGDPGPLSHVPSRLEMTPSAAISRDGPDGSSYWA